MKFEKGKQYECVKDVVMTPSGNIDYVKGRIYTCENEDCLTDETGEQFHYWSPCEAIAYFKLHEPKLGDKVFVWDDDERDAEELIFLAKADGNFPYVVFGEDFDYDEFKKGYSFKCLSFQNMKPLPQVETVSLKEALSILEAHKGVKCRIEECE